ncbi:RNA polymerase factor sigma-54 [Paenibacillus macerans]|uniref:RNA polymerase sigma-54 factor n=2 Tax=Paenibacillus macerans TaxID=44252 RepID=A0A090Z398_PAEMA|nr:RNA polymerase factor sigma-54 [Paenibacillus macerans]KFN05749.1 RNA polymerase sigma-54 factor [Paenibacillus macerans]MBS5909950.1 RNA polymerase factor sigma-54 [Paenibacillus macerans]MCY7557956.1 RNA polymerase factor sigma-54 [Paenibacillus macerans]MEC0138294.1 RNA polymerase factor sigma-54 [Paenibacillus macerans]MEC0152643.1 RNA polymerase factor sigma-54 [Paenibacillus macerans]
MRTQIQNKQRQSVQLNVNPQMLQTFRLLAMPNGELERLISEKAQTNPFIEILPLRPNRRMSAGLSRQIAAGLSTELLGYKLKAKTTSEEAIWEELKFSVDDPKVKKALQFLIGNLDEAGYLPPDIDRHAEQAGISRAAFARALWLLQQEGAPGIGARSLQECLELQLIREGRKNSLAYIMVHSYMEETARGDLPAIARETGAPLAEVAESLARIRKLQPRPGLVYEDAEPAPAVKDIAASVTMADGRLKIALNSLKISLYEETGYLESMKEACSIELRQKIEEAKALAQQLDYRHTALLKVLTALVRKQRAFFQSGIHELKPLKLEQIAGSTGMHPSTVSRAIKDKWLDTPWGVFSFKYFLAGGIEAESGDMLAAGAVKQMIRELIAGEDKRKPLTDQLISDLLQERGISISRRTVAKYRTQAKIAPASQRKLNLHV